jgi:MFS transporter, PAT family, beta-lactamase induction signal transducer AmpG
MVTFDLSTQIKLLAWTILIHTVFNALQDVAVDALAVDLLDDAERGRANGFMYGSKYLGGFIGGYCMVKLIGWFGFDTALVVQSSILLAIMLLPLFVRERSGAPPPRESPRAIVRALAQAFSLRSTLVTALLVLGANFATGLMTVTSLQLFIGELKWDATKYTSITGGWGLVFGGVFAAVGGVLTDHIGRRKLAAIASCALAVGWIAFVLLQPYWTYNPIAYALGFYEAACQATLSVSLFALCMDLAWPRIAGSQFSAYMALLNFSTTLGYLFAGRANEWWSFRGVYLVGGGIQLVITLLLIPIDPGETRRRLPTEVGGPIHRLGVGALIALVAVLVALTVYQTLRVLG